MLLTFIIMMLMSASSEVCFFVAFIFCQRNTIMGSVSTMPAIMNIIAIMLTSVMLIASARIDYSPCSYVDHSYWH